MRGRSSPATCHLQTCSSFLCLSASLRETSIFTAGENSMRIIITGGTGLIGQALLQQLLPQGHEIIVLSRDPERKNSLPGVTLARWDGVNVGEWTRLVDGADAVVNLAGESIAGTGALPARWTPERKRRILESRVNATNAIVSAIAQASVRPKVLVQ
jgi:NAD dependent epimerase/dehydratase family enzyme